MTRSFVPAAKRRRVRHRKHMLSVGFYSLAVFFAALAFFDMVGAR